MYDLMNQFAEMLVSTIPPEHVTNYEWLLQNAGHNSNIGPMFAITGSFLKRRGAAGGIALVNTVGITGGFLGPYYMGLAKDFTGSYQRGFLGLALACCFSLFLLTRLARRVGTASSWLTQPNADYNESTP